MGGVEYARAKARQFADEALSAIVDLPRSPSTAALADAVTYTVERKQ